MAASRRDVIETIRAFPRTSSSFQSASLRTLGIIAAIPLSILWTGDREFFVLHVFVFFPLCALYLAAYGWQRSRPTHIDKVFFVYLCWAVLSLLLNLGREALLGDSGDIT